MQPLKKMMSIYNKNILHMIIEKSIIGKTGAFIEHKILFYSKFYYKLNCIEYFWCNKKNWIKKYCKNSIEELRKDIPIALN